MKIEVRRDTGKKKVSMIQIGECFISDTGVLFMKTDERFSDKIRCVRFDHGVCTLFESDELVTPVEAKVVIE